MTFTVNGVAFVKDSSPPYAMTFTVPAGTSPLTFAAAAHDATGEIATATPVIVSTERDPSTNVTGRVVDSTGNPIRGAVVNLLSEGLAAEFFDFATPLASLPDLSSATPARTTRVSAVNMRGPNGVFGADPFGTGLSPDYAARFLGWIRIATSGTHTFFLGADEGARLRLGGVTLMEMATSATTGYQETSATTSLSAGLYPIEIAFYESVGNAQLQLSFVPPGGERQVVPPASLVPSPGPLSATTDDGGRFTFSSVPTALDSIQVQVTVTQGGQTTSAASVQVSPVSSNATDVGDIVVPVLR